jgi:hypothetical protein
MVGARHAVGAEQRAPVDLETDHGKLAVLEAEAGIACRPEAEQRIGPVLDGKNFLTIKRAHGSLTSKCPDRGKTAAFRS